MHAHIILDDELVKEAFFLSNIKTKQELVYQALQEFVNYRKTSDLRHLKGIGGLRDDYDYKALRIGKKEDEN